MSDRKITLFKDEILFEDNLFVILTYSFYYTTNRFFILKFTRKLMRLKSACKQRIKSCIRKNQNPLMETALCYMLLGTGLRESEVVSLNVWQYRQKGLCEVLRYKSKRISQKIPN